MRGNERSAGEGDEKQQPRHKDRHNDGKTRNVRQDKRRFILRDGTGPLRDRPSLGLTVAAGFAISYSVKMGNPILLHLLRQNTGRADDTGHEPDAHEQAGECTQSGPSTGRPREKHVANDGVHRQRSWKIEALTVRNSRRNCLPTRAHSCYSPHRIFAMRTAFPAGSAQNVRRETSSPRYVSLFTFHALRIPSSGIPGRSAAFRCRSDPGRSLRCSGSTPGQADCPHSLAR